MTTCHRASNVHKELFQVFRDGILAGIAAVALVLGWFVLAIENEQEKKVQLGAKNSDLRLALIVGGIAVLAEFVLALRLMYWLDPMPMKPYPFLTFVLFNGWTTGIAIVAYLISSAFAGVIWLFGGFRQIDEEDYEAAMWRPR